MYPEKLNSTVSSVRKYADIINLERPNLVQYPQMSVAARAAQFAPYKTITIYHDQIDNVETSSSVFSACEIIPDEDYFEYAEDFNDPECDSVDFDSDFDFNADFYEVNDMANNIAAENLDNSPSGEL